MTTERCPCYAGNEIACEIHGPLARREDAPAGEVWHVISGTDLRGLLRLAYLGEDPEMLYLREYANAERD